MCAVEANYINSCPASGPASGRVARLAPLAKPPGAPPSSPPFIFGHNGQSMHGATHVMLLLCLKSV